MFFLRLLSSPVACPPLRFFLFSYCWRFNFEISTATPAWCSAFSLPACPACRRCWTLWCRRCGCSPAYWFGVLCGVCLLASGAVVLDRGGAVTVDHGGLQWVAVHGCYSISELCCCLDCKSCLVWAYVRRWASNSNSSDCRSKIPISFHLGFSFFMIFSNCLGVLFPSC